MIKYLLILACAVIASEATGCQTLMACQNEITEEGFFSEDASMTGYINEAEVMDAVCGQLSPFTTCVESHLSGCSDKTVKDELKAVKDIVEYMCTTEGRALVLRLADSDCATGPLVEVQMEMMMQSCLESFQFEVQMEALNAAFAGREPVMSDFCPFIDTLETCLVTGSTNMCGADMGTFISNIWGIAARDQFAEFGCTASVSAKRRFVKRALPMLLKKAKMVKKLRR